MSKIRWSQSHNTAADLTVHARTTSIHPPISAVHPELDKPSTGINASIRPATGTRCRRPLECLMAKPCHAEVRRSRLAPQVLSAHRAAATPLHPDATLRSRLRRQGLSATGRPGPRITAPAREAGQSITRNHKAFGAKKCFTCQLAGTEAAATPPRLIADTQSGVGAGLSARRQRRRWPIKIVSMSPPLSDRDGRPQCDLGVNWPAGQ